MCERWGGQGGLSDLESFQIRSNRWRHSKGDHKASAVALYPGDVWLVFPTSTSSLTEHVAFIHGSGGGAVTGWLVCGVRL